MSAASRPDGCHAASRPLVIGAYASWPADRAGREDYLRALADEPWAGGLELPDPASFDDIAWLASHLAPHWRHNTVTAIPGTMQALKRDVHFGLASLDDAGRQAALDQAERLRGQILELNHAAGRPVVQAVQLHSAPSARPGVRASAGALAASLTELRSRDWQGAGLVLEHCDAPSPAATPEKGFLSLDDELALANELELGILLNWGRLCLEHHEPSRVLAEVARVRESGHLHSLMLSGASAQQTSYGAGWVDAHHPLSTDEPASLMTPAVVAECVAAATDPNRPGEPAQHLGVKVGAPADATVAQRLVIVRRAAQAAGVVAANTSLEEQDR